MMDWHTPYLTADIPGVGGIIRAEPEDFLVEEVPAYEPCGEGEHTFFLVEKREIATQLVVKQIAQALDVASQEVSYAGMKDARAVARQVFCVHSVPPERVLSLELERAQVLWARRHTNKLRVGHLRGNRFTLRIRQITDAARATTILERLAALGVPNAYGVQRFGRYGDNHELGLLLLRNDREGFKARGLRYPQPRMQQFYVSALQSALFNQWLSARMAAGTLDDVWPGDIAKKHTTGGIFTVEDAAAERPRAQAGEISATGPIYGYKMMAAQDAAGALETEILARAGLTPEAFRAVKAKGSRRPLRYHPEGLTWALEDAATLRVAFFAPKGSFATLLLREVMKVDADLGVAEGDDDE